MEAFYAEVMGFTRTEAIAGEATAACSLRCGTEHHSLALYPISLRQKLGSRPIRRNELRRANRDL